MAQNVVKLTVPRVGDFLEPVMRPNEVKEDHVKILAAGAGLFVSYAMGQVLAEKDDGTNVFAKLGTAGYDGARRIVKYAFTINDAGDWQYGASFVTGRETFSDTMAVIYDGYYKTQDLVGLDDDDLMNSCGILIRGTRTAGILHFQPRTNFVATP